MNKKITYNGQEIVFDKPYRFVISNKHVQAVYCIVPDLKDPSMAYSYLMFNKDEGEWRWLKHEESRWIFDLENKPGPCDDRHDWDIVGLNYVPEVLKITGGKLFFDLTEEAYERSRKVNQMLDELKKIEKAARGILDKYREAFLELAK